MPILAWVMSVSSGSSAPVGQALTQGMSSHISHGRWRATKYGVPVAIEVKRRGGIDGVEQLTRYLALLSRDPMLPDISGVFAAQEISRQARTLAEDRGIRCVVLDYDAMRGLDDVESRLF